MGWAVWGRTTGPLGKMRIHVPRAQWTINSEAFDGLVDPGTFDAAQRAIRNRTCNKSNDELLAGLRSLLKKEGRLSQHLIDASREIPASATYYHRFGSLRQAYELIGYQEFKNHGGMLRMRRRHRKVEVALLARIAKAVCNKARIVRERNVCRRVLCFGSSVRVSVLICQCLSLGNGKFRWGVPVNRFEKGYPTLICRCTPNNRGIKDMYLMPRIDTPHTHEFRIKDNDPWLKLGARIDVLSKLPRILDRLVVRTLSSSGQRSVESLTGSLL